jgi:hypothetical protein
MGVQKCTEQNQKQVQGGRPMKTKDLKTLLNKETDETTPDVLDNVKISPINKLKSNEKSMVAFKKTMSTLILVFLSVIVVVLSVAIHGLTTQSSATVNFTFLSIRVYDGTGDGLTDTSAKVYNFILDDNGKTVLAYNQSTNEKMAKPSRFEDILDAINYNGESTIYIIGASDSPAYARQFARGIEDFMLNDDTFVCAKIIAHVNNQLSKDIVASSTALLPNYNEKDGKEANSVNKLCTLYITLVD